MTMWHMRIECCVPKATNTITEYVIYCFSAATVVKQCYVIVPCVFVFVNGVLQQTDEFADEVGVYSVN